MGSTSTRSIASLSCYLRSRVRPTKTTPQEGSFTALRADTYHHRDFLIPNIALTPSHTFPIPLTSPKTPRRSPIPYRKIKPPPHYFDLSTASGQTNSLDLFPAEPIKSSASRQYHHLNFRLKQAERPNERHILKSPRIPHLYRSWHSTAHNGIRTSSFRGRGRT